LPLESQRALLVFHLSGQTAALPLESVERIAPMAQLMRPPRLPSTLEGILNLAGVAVPVLRLDRLLQLPTQRHGLYSMLIVVRGISDDRIAISVDRVSEIVSVPEKALLPLAEEASFNACAKAAAHVRGELIHLLFPARILLEKERERLSEFQAAAQERLRQWQLD
jgi:purine-binding chemotaxis protein CheW